MRKLTVPNLEILQWDKQHYIVPLNQLNNEDLAPIQSQGWNTVRKAGFFKRRRHERSLIVNEAEHRRWEMNETLAINSGINCVHSVESYEAFLNFKEAIRKNFPIFILLVTDSDIMERQITDEAYTQKNIALSFICRYVGATAIPSTREEVSLGDEIEDLAERLVDDILTQEGYRRELIAKTRDARRAISAVRYAKPGDLPKGVDAAELLRDSQQAFEELDREYNALIETTRDKLMTLKEACLKLNQEHATHSERSFLRSEVRFLEDLTRHSRA